jgi:N-acetylmuramoyl-L-alanine amidase CwlA
MLSAVAFADDYKASPPLEYKEKANQESGSIFEQLNKGKSKGKGTEDESLSSKEKIWNKVVAYMHNQGFQLENANASMGKYVTKSIKLPEYDPTGTCVYTITATVDTDGTLKIVISSQDAPPRLRAIEERIRQAILDYGD